MINSALCCETSEKSAQLATSLKALGHPVRMRIVQELSRRSCICGEMCSCFSLSQSTVSQHLSVLCEAGLVSVERKGNRSIYSLNNSAFEVLNRELAAIANQGKQLSS